jgi:preprotein translocase subunit SecE
VPLLGGFRQQLSRAGISLPGQTVTAPVKPGAKGARPAKAVPTERGFVRFVRETRSELKKVTWPTREQALRLTGVVIAVSAAVGLFMGGLDYIFELLFKVLLGTP